jgi:hypothetical protein
VAYDGKVLFTMRLELTVGPMVVEQPPVADAGSGRIVTKGILVCLDGSASSDSNNDLLSFNWSQIAAPAGCSRQPRCFSSVDELQLDLTPSQTPESPPGSIFSSYRRSRTQVAVPSAAACRRLAHDRAGEYQLKGAHALPDVYGRYNVGHPHHQENQSVLCNYA